MSLCKIAYLTSLNGFVGNFIYNLLIVYGHNSNEILMVWCDIS